jgi:hypothetical protein
MSVARKFKKGQAVRVRDLDELPNDTPDMPRSPAGLALASKIGKIVDLGGGYIILDLTANVEKNPNVVYPYEIEVTIDPALMKRFKVVLMDGSQYRIECTEEAMKEMAEFIGDDQLEMIHELRAG